METRISQETWLYLLPSPFTARKLGAYLAVSVRFLAGDMHSTNAAAAPEKDPRARRSQCGQKRAALPTFFQLPEHPRPGKWKS